MDARCTTTEVAGAIMVALDGVLDLASLPLVYDALRRVVADHPGSILIADLDGASAIDDAVLGVLMGAAADMRASEGDLRVVAGTPATQTRLTDRRFDRIVTVAETVVSALDRSSVDVDEAQSFYDHAMDDRGRT